MREFVIKRLRRAPIIEPLWDEFERMLAARDTAITERDAALAARDQQRDNTDLRSATSVQQIVEAQEFSLLPPEEVPAFARDYPGMLTLDDKAAVLPMRPRSLPLRGRDRRSRHVRWRDDECLNLWYVEQSAFPIQAVGRLHDSRLRPV